MGGVYPESPPSGFKWTLSQDLGSSLSAPLRLLLSPDHGHKVQGVDPLKGDKRLSINHLSTWETVISLGEVRMALWSLIHPGISPEASTLLIAMEFSNFSR